MERALRSESGDLDSAHHTQFMDPGWEYVGVAEDFTKGGSWVSVKSP